MWKLKEPVKIYLKRHRVQVTQESLAKNQDLAQIILDDPSYFAAYGHNLVNTDGAPAKQKDESGITINVDVKKKADAEKETKLQSEQSKPTVSISTNQQSDGMSLKLNAGKQESTSQGSKGKPGRKKGSSVVKR